MCGVALIVDGLSIDLSSINCTQQLPSATNVESFSFTIDDLKASLLRRGPDSLGTKRVILELKDEEILSYVAKDECNHCGNEETEMRMHQPFAEMHFLGAVLQLRGTKPVTQPLVDSTGNVLIYNGEIYAGIHMVCDSNDTEVLLQSLGNCCSCQSHGNLSSCSGKPVPELLSSIKGPWAAIYWQDASKTLWFGRDAFGRRSLLVHWPTLEDSRLVLSSVRPTSTAKRPGPDPEGEEKASNRSYWEELPCGVYSIAIDVSRAGAYLDAKVGEHEWINSMLKELIEWERKMIEPKHAELNASNPLLYPGNSDVVLAFDNGTLHSSTTSSADRVLAALKVSVKRRSTQNTIFKHAATCDIGQGNSVPVAVLFSGGVDSMILAAILHECLDARYGIDLLNVSFEGEAAPDRITARAGLKELIKIAPLRRWRLVEIDAELSNLTLEMKHVMSLINPANTYMDLNIGIALWLAAGGDGWVHEADNYTQHEGCQRFNYKSEARILLVGSGADEQCAGYGRHRTKFRNSGWLGLDEEMKLDMQRIWKRNLGRDDRCIADNGKEARFPFLDEDVIKILLDIPLWEIANLNQPSGSGDKKILREVARLLGIHEAAILPKRAIQFGSRIAQESNRMNFGSNRAANQASAGSVVINK
ncbi:Asparagine synthetase domain-containing protein 1 [Bienertia sinuspersici]